MGRERFPHVFADLSIKNIPFSNRIFFAAMGIDLAEIDGAMSPALREFYDGIAAGGCGYLVLSNATVSRDSILQPKGLRMLEQKHADSMKSFIKEHQDQGVLVGIQLQHYGGQGITKYTRGKALLTPSGIGSKALLKLDPRYHVREMNLEDIQTVIQQFADSAVLSADAGARIIQLQASNGYLLSSFLSPHTNKRTDEYGGSHLNRARLLIEVIQAIRARIGDATILSVRLGVDDFLDEQGSLPADFREVIPALEEAGMDMIEVSMGTAETFHKFGGKSAEMETVIQDGVRTIKGFSSVPVGFAGLVGDLASAEHLIASGAADMVGMARALFADNDLILKTVEDREESIHSCLWDGKCFKDKYNPRYARVYCCVNPKYLRPE